LIQSDLSSPYHRSAPLIQLDRSIRSSLLVPSIQFHPLDLLVRLSRCHPSDPSDLERLSSQSALSIPLGRLILSVRLIRCRLLDPSRRLRRSGPSSPCHQSDLSDLLIRSIQFRRSGL
jgi:hypothetical protein